MGYYNSRKSFAALAFAAAAFFITSCGDKSVSLESYSVNKVMHVVASDIPDSAQTYFNISLSLVFPENAASDSVSAKISKSIILEAYDDTTLLKLSPKEATDAFLASQMDGYKDEISFARQRRKEFIKNGENPPAFLLHNSELSLKTSSVYNDNGILSLRMEKSLYDGGAHSLPMIKLLSYSHKTGDRIFLEDIFQEGYEPKVRDEIVAAIKALMGMMPKVKSSVEAYQTLQKAIDQAYDNLYEYSNYAGAGAFNDLIMEAEDMYAEATANEEQIAEMIKRLDDGFLELKLSGVAVGIYVTNLMKNPGFEDLSAQGGVDSNGSANPPAGWDLYINDEKQTSAPPVGWCGINGGDDISFAGLYDDEGNPITVQYVEGTHLWGIWNGNIPNVELSQTLTGLPNGTYVLSANVMVQYQWAGNCLTTQRLFANDCVQMFGTEEEHAVNLPTDAQEANKTEGHLTYAGYTCTQDDPYTNTLRPMEVRFYVTDGTAKLGFRTSNINPDGTADTSTGHGWFKLDNFQLFYESEEIPEGIEGISESKGSVVSQRFFSADGRQQRSLSRGLNIVETRLSDGTVKTSKVIVK
jgi:hypothetical protein